MKFKLFKGSNGQWYFHIKAANGEKVAASEGYVRKMDAIKTILAIMAGAAKARVHLFDSTEGATRQALQRLRS